METDVKTAPGNGAELKGTFRESLYRNHTKIRQDRADAIIESAQVHYKRMVEDLALKIKQQKRELEGLLDLSPTDVNSLILASDFKHEAFVKKDADLRVTIYNDEKKLEILTNAYNTMFGETISV